MNLGPEGRRGEVAGAIPQVQLPSVAWGRRSWGEMSGLQETGANTRRQDRGRVRGEGGGVENGDAKNAFVLEWGGEEDAVDVDEARSENVDDSEDVDELDERMRGGTPSCAMPCQWREEIKSTPSSPDLPMSQNIHVTRSTWLLPPEMTHRTHRHARF